ncbi:MAG: sulfite exporter TauE/SafE family protein [Candidatus Omnitrophica bacterium]|jgi:sulfite exporter TauE/SafE|nr:sulfite exporter TauE/SafE family protein [Candidatus Omnitrophota bacterium]
MRENLYYLFLSGLILGSSSCLSICAPVLISYTVIYKRSLKESLHSYFLFSSGKLIGYMILGIISAIGVKILNSPSLINYLNFIYLLLALFIVIIGISMILDQNPNFSKNCNWLHKGNIRNVGVLGLLIGLSPCLPLLGILNYVVIISSTVFKAVFFTLVFGVGTVLSPLILGIVFSAKLGRWLCENKHIKRILKITSGTILIILGGKIILQRLLP